MKNEFFMPYAGNKREEVEEIYKNISTYIEDKKIIVEPFCGSCSMSLYISLQNPKKFKYILNDNNKHLINLLTIAKDENKLNELVNDLNNTIQNINSKEEYNLLKKEDNIISYIILNSYYNMKPGLYPQDEKRKKKKKDYNDFLKKNIFLNFLRNEEVELYNEDAISIYNTYKDNEECVILCDPPYLSTSNDFYLDPSIKIYEHIYKNNMIYNKAFIAFVLDDMFLINLLFEKYKSFKYNKKYNGFNRKLSIHSIYINEPS